MSKYLIGFLSLFHLYVFSCNALAAATIKILDQNGKPVKHAVVAIPAPEDFRPDLKKLAVIDQINKQFVPNLLIINKGQEVNFPNSDDVRHNVYSFSNIKPFQLRLYKGSSQKPILYDKAGIGVLGCNIHDSMVAHIYVADQEIAKITNADGIVTFQQSIPESIAIWHAELAEGALTKIYTKVEFEEGQRVASIELLAPQQTTESNTFGSRKFGSKGN